MGATLQTWMGTIVFFFTEVAQYPQVHMGDYVDEARTPKAVATPKEPTRQERELFELTRSRYRN
eukprot:11188592-Lingulodinium_polyedra.AAC.1